MAKISVLLPDREDARFCAYCRDRGHKKSTFIAHLIKQHLDKERIGEQVAPARRPSQHRSNRNVLHRRVGELKSTRREHGE
jgi:hypothetical protein